MSVPQQRIFSKTSRMLFCSMECPNHSILVYFCVCWLHVIQFSSIVHNFPTNGSELSVLFRHNDVISKTIKPWHLQFQIMELTEIYSVKIFRYSILRLWCSISIPRNIQERTQLSLELPTRSSIHILCKLAIKLSALIGWKFTN